MEKLLSSKSGMAAILVIIILVVAVGASGATVLAVRMVVTGEDYLQPFVDLGWISSEEDDDDDEAKEEVIADEDSEDTELGELYDEKRLTSEARSSSTVQYAGVMNLAELANISSSNEYYEAYAVCEIELSVFAKNDKVVEIVFHMDFEPVMKKMYELFGDESEYDSYEEFEEEFLPYFSEDMTESFGFDEESDEWFELYFDDYIFEAYITESGFEEIYEEYGIDADADADVDEILEGIENDLGITMKKV